MQRLFYACERSERSARKNSASMAPPIWAAPCVRRNTACRPVAITSTTLMVDHLPELSTLAGPAEPLARQPPVTPTHPTDGDVHFGWLGLLGLFGLERLGGRQPTQELGG